MFAFPLAVRLTAAAVVYFWQVRTVICVVYIAGGNNSTVLYIAPTQECCTALRVQRLHNTAHSSDTECERVLFQKVTLAFFTEGNHLQVTTR